MVMMNIISDAIVFFLALLTQGSCILPGTPLLPSYLQPCDINGADFESCAIALANTIFEKFGAGEPLLQILPTSRIPLGFLEARTESFEGNGTDVFVYGFENLRAFHIRKLENGLETEVRIPKLVFSGIWGVNSHLNGQHIVTSINGNATYHNVVLKYTFKWNVVTRLGIRFIEVTERGCEASIERLEFNSDPSHGESAGYTLWVELNKLEKVIFQNVKGRFELYVNIVFDIFTKTLFALVPYDVLFLKIGLPGVLGGSDGNLLGGLSGAGQGGGGLLGGGQALGGGLL